MMNEEERQENSHLITLIQKKSELQQKIARLTLETLEIQDRYEQLVVTDNSPEAVNFKQKIEENKQRIAILKENLSSVFNFLLTAFPQMASLEQEAQRGSQGDQLVPGTPVVPGTPEESPRRGHRP